MTTDPFASLTAVGLNLHAVMDLSRLPSPVVATLGLTEAEKPRWRQLILLGNMGTSAWDALQARGMHGSDPLDTWVTERVTAWMQGPLAGHHWRLVFPGPTAVGLQALGQLAGWHHPSPFWVGVDAHWGSWFAYRAVVLADTDLPLTPRRELASPCLTCDGQPCVSACPAEALKRVDEGTVHGTAAGDLGACMSFRLRAASPCQDRCLARQACPVGEAHRYGEAQMAYHYLQSLPALRRWAA